MIHLNWTGFLRMFLRRLKISLLELDGVSGICRLLWDAFFLFRGGFLGASRSACGLFFCSLQESSPIRGGVLADEMGMGKTIQAISLIVSARHRPTPLPQEVPSAQQAMVHEVKGARCRRQANSLPEVKATLVICPLVAVIQWRQEIARFTAPGSVKVVP